MKTRDVISSVTSSESLVRVSLAAACFFCSCSTLPTRPCAFLELCVDDSELFDDLELFNCRAFLLDLNLLGASIASTNATDAKAKIAKT